MPGAPMVTRTSVPNTKRPKRPDDVLTDDIGVYVEPVRLGLVKVTLAKPLGNSEWFLQTAFDRHQVKPVRRSNVTNSTRCP
jgi:hypothetical protein